MSTIQDSPATWEWESRAAARARSRSEIQQIGQVVAPHVAAGDFSGASQALATATQPAQGTPTAFTKMISDNLKQKLGMVSDAAQAASTRPQSFEGRPTAAGGSDQSPDTLAGETFAQTYARKAREDAASSPSESLLGVPGLKTSLSDAAGGVNTLLSGRKFVQGVTQGRVDTADLPGPILPTIADMGLAPATIASAGLGGVAGGGARAVGATLAKRWAANTAIATAGALTAQGEGQLQQKYAESNLPGADIAGSTPARLVGSTAAFVAGAAAAHKFGPAALEAAKNAPETVATAAARTGVVPAGAVPGGGMLALDHPAIDAYLTTLEKHGIDFSYEPDGTIKVSDPGAALKLADDLESAGANSIIHTTRQGGVPVSADVWGEQGAYQTLGSNHVPIKQKGTRGFEVVGDVNHDAFNEAERIREAVDPTHFAPPDSEAARTTMFPPGTQLADYTGEAPAGMAANRAAILKATDARIQQIVGTGNRTPVELAREIAAEEIAATSKTAKARFAQAATELEAKGFDIAHTVPDGQGIGREVPTVADGAAAPGGSTPETGTGAGAAQTAGELSGLRGTAAQPAPALPLTTTPPEAPAAVAPDATPTPGATASTATPAAVVPDATPPEPPAPTVGFPGDAVPPSGHDGPRITTAADGSERNVPARGNADAALALEQKQVMTTPQGRVSQLVDNTPIVRRIAAAINPARDMPANVVTAYRAEGGVGSMLRSTFSTAMKDPTETLAKALADNPPEYIGPKGTPAQMALIGTAKDVLDRPEFYRIQPNLRAAMNYYDRTQWDNVTAPVRAGYNVDVQPYGGNPGSVYTPTMVARGSEDARIAQAMKSLASTANTKTRLYESAWDRVGNDPKFQPETDLRNLTDAHSKAMARNAANETFKLGAGGKTGTQVAEELHPELLKMKTEAKNGLASLRSQLNTATRQQSDVIGQFMKQQTVINKVAARMEPLQARVDALGEEYGPELSYLSGQVHELQMQKTALQTALKATGQRVVFRGTQTGALMDAIDKAQTRVSDLVKSYANASTDPYVFDRNTMRYYTPDVAKAVSELKRQPVGFLKSTIDTLDEIRAWHFSGDASPLTIQGQLGAIGDPLSAARTARGVLGDGRMSPSEALTKIAQEQPKDVAAYSFSMNRPFGEIGPEFRQPVGLAHLPVVGGKLSSIEQNMFAFVERQTFDMWKRQRDDLMAHGLEENAANHAAAAVTQQVIPSLDPTRRAISPLRAGVERAAFTSTSFATSPALMLKDATVGLVKLGTARTLNPGDAWAMLSPREQLAIKRSLTLAATAGTISAASAAASAESRGLSVKDAILETFDPHSRYFAAIQLGSGRAVPIGGPMRGFLKALAPSEFTADKDGIPMAGLWDYATGKLNSAPRATYDLIANSDYNGNKIPPGTFGQQVLQALWYAGENVAPMSVGQVATDTRQANLSLSGTASRVAAQFAGTNYAGPSPTEQLNQISRSQGHGDFYSADPSVQKAIKDANPSLWQQAVNQGSANRQKAEGLKKQTLQDQQGDDQLLLSGKLDVSKWSASADDRKTQLIGAEGAIYGNSPATSGAHPILDQFYQHIDASKVNGTPDMNAVYAWVATLSPAAQQYIDQNTGLNKTPLQKLRSGLLNDYYALPKYRGYTPDQSSAIDDALDQARNNAKGSDPAYVLQALRNLTGVDPDIMKAARKVVLGLVSTTNDRSRWAKAHPESVIMYGSGKLTPEQSAAVSAALAKQK